MLFTFVFEWGLNSHPCKVSLGYLLKMFCSCFQGFRHWGKIPYCKIINNLTASEIFHLQQQSILNSSGDVYLVVWCFRLLGGWFPFTFVLWGLYLPYYDFHHRITRGWKEPTKNKFTFSFFEALRKCLLGVVVGTNYCFFWAVENYLSLIPFSCFPGCPILTHNWELTWWWK